MKNFIIRGAAIGLLASLAAAGAAQSAPLKTGYYTVNHMAMVAAGVASDTYYGIDWTGGLRNYATDPACFNAAVNLPNGATVTRVTVWYSSKATGREPAASLVMNELSAKSTASIAAKNLRATAGKRKSATLSLPPEEVKVAPGHAVIDNAHRSYGFGVCLNGGNVDVFYAARITYTYVD